MRFLRQAIMRTMSKEATQANEGHLGFERLLWAAADKLRGHMDVAEHKRVALGLVF